MEGRLWIDPDLNGERAVSFDVKFTTPPDRRTVQRDAALKVSGKGLMLAKPEFVWGENGTCLIKSRILSLAKTSAAVQGGGPPAGDGSGNLLPVPHQERLT